MRGRRESFLSNGLGQIVAPKIAESRLGVLDKRVRECILVALVVLS
jgi:hypothetical protein